MTSFFNCKEQTDMDEKIPFQLCSDLHLELRTDFPRILPLKKILVLAGDIGHIQSQVFRDFIQYTSENWEHVIFVPGNREFYHTKRSYDALWSDYVSFMNSFTNVYFTDGTAVEIDDFVYYGATMWSPSNGTGKIRQFDQKIASWDHLTSLHEFLKLYAHHPRKVIVTHFPILRDLRVIPPQFHDQSPEKMRYFACDWIKFLNLAGVKAICSGHTHQSFDFFLDEKNVRLMSNQLGFPDDDLVDSGWKPNLLFE